METPEQEKKSQKNQDKVIIHPVELKRRRDELLDMVIHNEEMKKKVIQFPTNKK